MSAAFLRKAATLGTVDKTLPVKAAIVCIVPDKLI